MNMLKGSATAHTRAQSSPRAAAEACIVVEDARLVLEKWVKAHGGTKVIRKILISNNGLGAAKAIRSMRMWAYQTFRRDDMLTFVAMVTPEDAAANAEYIRLADEFVNVPGGSNRNNYANVELIVKVARRCEADAVWPGWGHASENPKLPATLAHHGITFIGPSAEAMDAVGDKICANLLAQSVGVNVIPWSGTGLTVPDITIPADTLHKATLHSLAEAMECVKRVGYPCMIKASEGGGGKGIRKVNNDEEMRVGYEQVEAEVPGSPIFIQKLSTDSRHLEVQMIADGQGSVVALYGRDCSVQRRHQKIIEEGPAIIAPMKMRKELEQGACRLGKKVGYRGAGTVEYLYNMKTGEYSFLEVNPRLQVEHPVTEHITGVNVPATQLQIAMGLRLSRIADIRRFFGKDPAGTDDIDFDNTEPVPPKGHCVAVRITAENAEDGFKPTSGNIHQLAFRGVPGITAYFSVGSANSGVHQFADSQFGHIFALAPTRDAAIALVANSLDDLVIRGEICSNKKYLQHLLEKPAFVKDTHDTAWLDGLIAEKDAAPRPGTNVIVLCGAVMVAADRHRMMEDEVLASLQRGVAPEKVGVNLSEHSFELIYADVKYRLRVTMGGPSQYYIWVNGELVEAEVLALPDGALKVLLGARSHIVHKEPTKSGLKCHVDGWPCVFPEDFDPTVLLAPSSGKIVRYLVPSGGHVVEGRPYIEIESMKMILPLLATSTGTITHTKTPGAAIDAGSVVGTVMLDDPSAVKKTEIFNGKFPQLPPRRLTSGIAEGSFYLKFHLAVAGIRKILAGYDCTGDPLEALLAVMSSPQLVADDFNEQKAAVSAKCPAPKLAELAKIGEHLNSVVATWKGPTRSMAQLDDVALAVKQVAEWVSANGADVYPEMDHFVKRFEHGMFAHECAVLTSFLQAYLDVEEPFASNETFADAVLALSQAHKSDLRQVVALAHSHSKLPRKSMLVLRVLDVVDAYGLVEKEQCMSQVARFVGLQRAAAYATVSQRAKQIILKKQEETRDSARRWKMHQASLVKAMPVIKEPAAGAVAEGDAPEPISMRHSVSGYLLHQGGTPLTDSPLLSSFNSAAARRGSAAAPIATPSALSLDAAPAGAFTWANLFDFGDAETQKAALKEACAALGVPNATVLSGKGTLRVQMLPNTMTYVAPSLGAVGPLVSAHDGDEAPAAAFLVLYPELAQTNAEGLVQTLDAVLRGIPVHEAVEQVWFTLVAPGSPHQSFAFKKHANGDFKEESVCRSCNPVAAAQLELPRLSTFAASCLSMMEPRGGRAPRGADAAPSFFQGGDYRIGVYLAEEKALQGKVQRDRRLFVRAAVYNKALLLPSKAGPTPPALLSGFAGGKTGSALALPDAAVPPHRRRRGIAEDSVLADIMGSMELAVGQHHTAWNFIFVNVVGSAPEDIEGAEEVVHAFTNQCFEDLRRLNVAMVEVRVGPGRVVAYNKTSYHYHVEFQSDMGTPRPYPALTKLQRKRMVAQSVNTTYCYDFIELFAHQAKAALASVDPSLFTSEMPAFTAVELALVPGSNPPRLEAVSRPSGSNDVGVVVWRCSYVSSSYIDGRDFILIANDITHMSGSFSPAEDDVYVAGAKLAQAEGIPCVFVSANSGARIGLDEQLKAAFKAAWINPQDPGLGFKYLYLEDNDYKFLKEKGSSVVVEPHTEDGEMRWVLRDVPGGLGVECLQGSGAIASVTSEAFQNTFTLTYVTARSVGIGAYCARLSRRIIQHQEAPLILTGASALNKLLGRDVYTSNNQIGGPKVMHSNGVSHQVVPDDVDGVRAILDWLKYVPKKRGAPLPLVPTSDPIRRAPHFTPPKGPYDPREMLAGFFDTGSFSEVMGDWGKSVVAGRACLGGLPLGVVAVETRLSEKVVPADPAFVGAQQTMEQQAGQVWFPDSSFKTAQAIGDFNQEGIPLMVFANWRGFAGGLRDMFGEVLKFGAMIVDALREFRQPVLVYIPHEGELRGGAWVVIDSQINPRMMEFYAAEASKGGVLEPEGIVDIKFRKEDLVKAMRRTLPHLSTLQPGEAAKVEAELLPLFKQVAVQFAALHDTPGVMKHKSVIKQVVPWAQSREFFAKQLRRRVAEERVRSLAAAAHPEADTAQAVQDLSANIEAAVSDDGAITMDSPAIAAYLNALRGKYVKQAVAKLAAENPVAVRSAVGAAP